MINNNKEYEKARNESEPLFNSTQYVNGNRLVKGCLTTAEQDYKLHADEIGMFRDFKTHKRKPVLIDVKHVTQKNFERGNYSLSFDLIEMILNIYEKDKVIRAVKEKVMLDDLFQDHYLALRIVDKDIQTSNYFETNNFLLVETKDVVEKCEFIVMNEDRNDTYFLVNIDDIRSKCATSIEKA